MIECSLETVENHNFVVGYLVVDIEVGSCFVGGMSSEEGLVHSCWVVDRNWGSGFVGLVGMVGQVEGY